MTGSKLKSKIDIWIVGLLIVCGVSMSMVFSLVSAGQASAFDLDQTAPKRYHSPMATRDGCYSNLNEVGELASIFGTGQWGLVNAIMNVPVYDWDQGTGPAAYHAQTLISPKGAMRGDVLAKGQAVGYMKDFNFTETPVPNPYWVQQWLMNPEPPFIAKSGDYVANPFFYQQFAAINESGEPIPALVSDGLPSLSDDEDTGLYDDATGGISDMDDLLDNNDDGRTDTALDNSDMLEEDYKAENLTNPDLIGQLVSGVFGFASIEFGVRGNNPADNCYEHKDVQSGYSAPSYAFSSINAAVPVTIPGWAYSPITLLDGNSISSSGITFYMGGTVNDKFILDCYGRGKQPIVAPAGYSLNDGRAFTGGLGSAAANLAMAAAVTASTPPLCLPFVACVPNLIAIWNNLDRTEAVKSAWENYFYGFAFAFTVDPTTSFNLPDYLDRRVINMGDSKFFDINARVLAASPITCGDDYHGCSQNGAQFNPNVYVTLKEPYVLNSEIDFGTDEHHRMPDGQVVTVDVNALKNGFNDDSDDGYEPYETSRAGSDYAGGPTYNDNLGSSGESFTEASIYRIEMKPGVVPNAIDIDRLNYADEDQLEELRAYRSNPATANPCSFFHDRLLNGDDSNADESRVPDEEGSNTNANEHRPAFSEEGAYECERIDAVDLRMDTGVHSATLDTYSEEIDSETPPGTKICYAVYYNHYTNDSKYDDAPWWKSSAAIGNYNDDYSAPEPGDDSYLSRAKCIVVGYKPSFQVRGGDLIVGGDIHTNTNVKDVIGSDPAEKRTYGSWSEYGTIAGGVVKRLGTGGAYRLGMPSSLTGIGRLTFSNNRADSDASVHNHGHYDDPVTDGFDKVSNRFSQAAETAEDLTGPEINLYELDDGTYTLPTGPVNVVSEDEDGNEAAIDQKTSIILLAKDSTTVNIRSNLRIPLEYDSAGDISQIVIAATNQANEYDINIAHSVTQVDAWLINQNGSINTCWIPGAAPGDYRLTPRSLGECDNTLYINGPVAADTIFLRRNGGKDQSSDPTELHQSVPGEVFNLRPDNYLWAANHVGSSNKKYITTHVLDLPPRY